MENFRTNCPGNFALQLSSPGPEIIGIQIMYLLTCTKTALRWDTFSWHLVTSVTTQGHVRNSTSFHNRQSSESRKVEGAALSPIRWGGKESFLLPPSNIPNFATCKQATFPITFKKSIIVMELLTKAIFSRFAGAWHHYYTELRNFALLTRN